MQAPIRELLTPVTMGDADDAMNVVGDGPQSEDGQSPTGTSAGKGKGKGKGEGSGISFGSRGRGRGW